MAPHGNGEEHETRAIAALIQTAATLLDGERFDGWLELFDDSSDYQLSAYSPELKKEMSWWKSDRASLQKILLDIPKHVRDPARRLHIVTPVSIEVSGITAKAVSTFAVFRTTTDGETRVYVVGRYEDELIKKAGRWLYASRNAVLQTRLLDAPTHLPI